MKTVFAVLALGLFICGILLAGSGVTGYVTAQSCCIGQTCAAEYQCSVASTLERERQAGIDGNIGFIFIAAAGLVYYFGARHD